MAYNYWRCLLVQMLMAAHYQPACACQVQQLGATLHVIAARSIPLILALDLQLALHLPAL